MPEGKSTAVDLSKLHDPKETAKGPTQWLALRVRGPQISAVDSRMWQPFSHYHIKPGPRPHGIKNLNFSNMLATYETRAGVFSSLKRGSSLDAW